MRYIWDLIPAQRLTASNAEAPWDNFCTYRSCTPAQRLTASNAEAQRFIQG